jgi:hypothetical protein
VRRRLLNLLTVLSLPPCVAVCALWVRSYWATDELTSTWTTIEDLPEDMAVYCPRVLSIGSSGGRCRVAWSRNWLLGGRAPVKNLLPKYRPHGPDLGLATGATTKPSPGEAPFGSRFGFAYSRHRSFASGPNRSPSEWSLVVPHALLVALFLTPPALRTTGAARRRRRRQRGHCFNCGYDLRASPERCPECGAMPSPQPVL